MREQDGQRACSKTRQQASINQFENSVAYSIPPQFERQRNLGSTAALACDALTQ